MRENLFLPRPAFSRYVCFPDMIGGYRDYPEHEVHREAHSTDMDLDKLYNLHIVLSGRGYVVSEGITYELTRGHGFLYGPGLSQRYHADRREPWEIRWAHFFGRQVEELLDGKGLGQVWLFATSDITVVERSFDRMLEMGRTYRIEEEAAVSAQLYEILMRIQQHATQLNASSDNALEKMRIAANFIRTHYRQPLTLADMAAQAGYSHSYFSRKFHELMGQKPMEMLLESRLLYAKRLLVSTPLAVKEIALESGFTQSSYFISCFRRAENMTPEQFRTLHRVSGAPVPSAPTFGGRPEPREPRE